MGNSPDSLPYLNAEANTVTFSGFSAGCFMSHQMSIIYPDEIAGVGLFCCWPYGTKAELNVADVSAASIALIEQAAADNKIGSTSDIANQAVYIWTGLDDITTPPEN